MNQPLLWMLAAALGGLLVGIAAGFYLGRGTGDDVRRRKELERELGAVTKGYAAFRKQVHRHFTRTAKLAVEAGTSQRALHEHLARGAHALAGQVLEPTADPTSEFPIQSAPPTDPGAGTRAPRPTPRPTPRAVPADDAAPRHPAMAAPVDFPRS
ncbi:hypothetical protein BMS3Bbin12_01564 [bacterium BMS3Bbin12]|nr:hypothetical protein BMS3Bbin12_01564 [bacterium BMS3Bbin12]GBE50531.1 hypothetical protein BMS3Bbin13_01471 [bacterium BMS3Bbin13]